MIAPSTASQLASPEKLSKEPTFDRLNVLLVDDSAFACSIGKRALQSAGLRFIQESTSGQKAIEFLAKCAPAVDVVFCDLMMPDMDGIQITRHLATLAVPPAIVFVSGADEVLLSTAENAARARGLRVIGSIEKPLRPAAVRRALACLGDAPVSNANRSSVIVTADDVELALERKEFVPYFQPIVSLADGSIAGFEALARWNHRESGLVFPATFIPIAEQTEQISALTDQIMTQSLEQCAVWGAAGMRVRVSVNLSAYMLVDLDLPDRIAREADRFQVEPRQVILEITESGLFQDSANTLDILARLHMKGFSLSIDDFGTGYSSLEQLRRVPFAELKIDRTFVHGAGENAKDKAILISSANLGRSLRMSVVAEGVETQEDWNAVRAAGVDLAQGYFIGKPMAAERIPEWLTQWSIQRAAQ
jgi:EAL domain-containing protein (putative c-di-GMP-specific phosphodiesterase class I)/DNA-binding NarL/FixJ family response regulator